MICVLCNNSINLYSICSAVCTLSGVFHNIIIIIIIIIIINLRESFWVHNYKYSDLDRNK